MKDTETYPLEGGCACGGVRYAMQSPPMFVHCCHCTWCQRESGSAFALNALIETSRVTLLHGEVEPFLTPSASGRGQKIYRCPQCKVAVWSHYPGAGEVVAFVRVGTLDAPHSIRPDAHIFTSTKQPWVALGDSIPVFEQYYERDSLWSEDKLSRRRSV